MVYVFVVSEVLKVVNEIHVKKKRLTMYTFVVNEVVKLTNDITHIL